MTDDAVTVGWVHNGVEMAASWVHSLLALVGYDQGQHGRVARGGYIGVQCPTNRLPESRNKLVELFLAGATDWLLMLDTDMGFEPDVVDRLLDVADPVDRPIVGALCFSYRQSEADGMGGYRATVEPTVLDWTEVDGKRGFSTRKDYPANTVTRVAGTGAACLLVHRTALEKISAEYGGGWFDQALVEGKRLGEDLSFCLRAGALGIPVHVHTGVRTSHAKTIWVSELDYQTPGVLAPGTGEPVAADSRAVS